MASLLRRMSSRKEKISEPEAPPTPAADEDDGRVNVRAYNKKTGEVTIMRVQKGTPMGEVFKHYAERKGVAENSLTRATRGRRGAPGPADEETKEDTFPAKPPEKKQDATCIVNLPPEPEPAPEPFDPAVDAHPAFDHQASAGSDYMELTIEGLDDDEWI
ncbi:hypothetical protein JL720_16916 [Aureococcus anophagefferens]|nr:hypothetical protein JL720_16916 [Aureococcus anophagefferens]